MKTNRLIFGIILMMAFSVPSVSQQLSTLYFMNIPQNHLLNPALKIPSEVYVGIPIITGINANFNTNFIGLSDIFNKTGDGELISILNPDFDKDAFLAKVKQLNYITPGATIQTFGFGFTIGKDLQFYLDINEKLDGKIALPYDLFNLAFNGAEDLIGKTVDLTETDIDLIMYREIGAGFSKNILPRLRVGARAKLIMGMAAANIETRNLRVEVLADDTQKMTTDFTVNISAPLTVIKDGEGRIEDVLFNDDKLSKAGYYFNADNLGFGLDIGAVYSLTRRITLSAALNGFGFINWNRDITNITAQNEFTYTGFDLNAVIEGTAEIEDVVSNLLDSLENSFIITDVTDPFKSVLPGTLTLAGSYSLTESISFGVVSSTLFVSGKPRTSLMLSANANLAKGFCAGLSYTASNQSYDNLGLGLAGRLGPVQIYIISDKIPFNFSRVGSTEDDSGKILLPDKWNTLSFRFGINLVFGSNPKKKSDKPMVLTTDQI